MTAAETLIAAAQALEYQAQALRREAAAITGDAPSRRLRAVKEIAPSLGMSEKRLRRIAPTIGAEVRIGGRVLIDEGAVAAHLQGKFWANLSTVDAPEIIDDGFEVKDNELFSEVKSGEGDRG
jgi:hypothetical protein